MLEEGVRGVLLWFIFLELIELGVGLHVLPTRKMLYMLEDILHFLDMPFVLRTIGE